MFLTVGLRYGRVAPLLTWKRWLTRQILTLGTHARELSPVGLPMLAWRREMTVSGGLQ